MNIPFLDNWRKRPADTATDAWSDPEGVAQLLSECDLLRARAQRAGVVLGDTPVSLEALDQLLPRWRDDPEELPELANDAGLYLGTVIVRTVPGAHWGPGPEGRPVVVMASGREVDVVTAGQEWADTGTPELSQVYAEVAEV
ncbi:DUF6278 family protein [Streptomyces radicis]|uniref:Uncharacterized protein n=1 Tax=Streptomyces radicis TaxID=1750517 RepID=A0A3A9W271_9ACTN|nr:DUF6278 family protein [Streptomyces radicis]RKN07060.1 hypothetical protein D7319_20435 [Streptomyces radicis]RKN15121.1 hypothetical protein D7318_28305 [Streptomyces radicis]